jgi:hypothetical protein
MAWMVATQSALSFSFCYLIIFAYLANVLGKVSPGVPQMAMALGYLVLIPGLLISGLAITLESWAIAYRNRGIASFGLAAYNTYAQIHNMYYAARTVEAALEAVFSFFSSSSGSTSSSGSSSKRKNDAFVVLLIVVGAVVAGISTTAIIIRQYAATDPLPPWEYLKAQQAKDTYLREV